MALTLNGSANTIGGLAVGGLPDGCIQAADLAASVNTITEVDQWRITASFTTDDANPIGANWERSDTGFTKIGTGMTQSSGVFTFPSTGIWLINFSSYAYAVSAERRYIGYSVYNTTNSGSNWYARSYVFSNMFSHDPANHTTGFVSAILDITNTSTHKVRFRVDAEADVTFKGGTDENYTYAQFLRLGDT